MSRDLIGLILQATGESHFMVSVAALLATVFGLPIGIFLATSRKGELFAAPAANGVLGVIGPTRLNYARVIPTVDYAARIVSRMLAG